MFSAHHQKKKIFVPVAVPNRILSLFFDDKTVSDQLIYFFNSLIFQKVFHFISNSYLLHITHCHFWGFSFTFWIWICSILLWWENLWNCNANFLVKSHFSCTRFSSFNNFFCNFMNLSHFLKQLIAFHGAKMSLNTLGPFQDLPVHF